MVHSASIQDRDGGVLVMATLFGMFPFLRKLYADGGYQGPAFQAALRRVLRGVDVEIVKRSDQAKGFVVLPKRVRRSAPNRRTHHRLAQPLPQARQGLGEPEPQRTRLPPAGIDQAHGQEAMQSKGMIGYGLSGHRRFSYTPVI